MEIQTIQDQIEKWKTIHGYPHYQISNLGRIRTFYVTGGRGKTSKIPSVKAISFNSSGYALVSLSQKNKRKTFLVHRLVAKTFISNRENKKEVNHLSGNKTDNSVKNLGWCSSSENANHAYLTGLKVAPKGKNHWKAILTELQVREIRLMEKSQKEIARIFGVSQSHISDIIRMKKWKHI